MTGPMTPLERWEHGVGPEPRSWDEPRRWVPVPPRPPVPESPGWWIPVDTTGPDPE